MKSLALPNNPILGYPDWSIKDACLAYANGRYHVYFSAFDEERSFVTKVSSPDLLEFSDFEFWLDGRDYGHIGFCSPDVAFVDERWVCIFNSWGDKLANPNRLFYIESDDLGDWSEVKPLAHELYAGIRVIDGAVTYFEGQYYLCYKLTGEKRELRMAVAENMDGPWELIAEEPVRLVMEDGKPNGLVHENAQLLMLDGVPHILTTDYKPHAPYVYRMMGDPSRNESWLTFGNGRRLDIPKESWNTVDDCNAAALCDLRAEMGYAYLIYAGKDEQKADGFVGAAGVKPWARGWNHLGVARSKDLRVWETGVN